MEGDSYVFVVGESVRGVKEIQSARALKFKREIDNTVMGRGAVRGWCRETRRRRKCCD